MRLTYIFTIAALLISTSAVAGSEGLPQEFINLMKSANATGDQEVINGTADAIKKAHPGLAGFVDDQIKKLTSGEEATIAVAKVKEEAAEKPKEEKKNWKANVEAGAVVENGNSKSTDLHLNSKLTYSYDNWDNILEIKAENATQQRQRDNEKYSVNNQSRRNLSDRDYVFLELEYVNDRFSGFDYRTSESLGYGYYFVKDEDLKISGEASLGARQTKETGTTNQQDTTNSFLTKLGGDVDWKINSYLAFIEELDISVGEELVVTNSITSLKTAISDSLYFKLSYEIEHYSDVSAGKKQLDTTTRLSLGYEF